MYTRVQTIIKSLLRELSGPRPLRRAVDIVSKPRIWSHGAKTILLDNISKQSSVVFAECFICLVPSDPFRSLGGAVSRRVLTYVTATQDRDNEMLDFSES